MVTPRANRGAASQPTKADHVSAADQDRVAARSAAAQANDLIKEAEAISAPPEAKTKADEAKKEAQKVSAAAKDCTKAFEETVKAPDVSSAETKAGEVKLHRVKAEDALDEAKRLLAEAKSKLPDSNEAIQKLDEVVKKVTQLREDAGKAVDKVTEVAEAIRNTHKATPTDVTRLAVTSLERLETSSSTNYDDCRKAENAAKRAAKTGNEKAVKQAEKTAATAKEAAEDAALEASDLQRDVNRSIKKAGPSVRSRLSKVTDESWKPSMPVMWGLAAVAILLELVAVRNWIPSPWVIGFWFAWVGLAISLLGFRWLPKWAKGVHALFFVTIIAALVVFHTSAPGSSDNHKEPTATSAAPTQTVCRTGWFDDPCKTPTAVP